MRPTTSAGRVKVWERRPRGMPEVMPVTDDVARYREIERLGIGGMATVTLAEDTMLRRRVALKRSTRR